MNDVILISKFDDIFYFNRVLKLKKYPIKMYNTLCKNSFIINNLNSIKKKSNTVFLKCHIIFRHMPILM